MVGSSTKPDVHMKHEPHETGNNVQVRFQDQEENSATSKVSHGISKFRARISRPSSLSRRTRHWGSSATHGNIGEINKPPGIHTLEEWGQIRAPSGKYPGSTFAEIFQKDQVYVQHMWNRRGVSSWVRSFQMYCRAVRKLEPSPDYHRGYQAPVAPKSMSKSKPPTTVTGEWTKIEKTGEAMKTNPKGENKRSMQEPKNEMQTEANPNESKFFAHRSRSCRGSSKRS